MDCINEPTGDRPEHQLFSLNQPNLKAVYPKFVKDDLPEIDPEPWDIFAHDASMKKVPTVLDLTVGRNISHSIFHSSKS